MTETITTKSQLHPEVGPVRVRDATKPGARQLVRFAFYRVMPEWRRLDQARKETQRQELAKVLTDHAAQLLVRTCLLYTSTPSLEAGTVCPQSPHT